MHGQGEALNVGIRVFLFFIRVIGKGHLFFIVFVKRDQILHLVSVKVLLHNFVVPVFMWLNGPIVIPIRVSGLAVLLVDRINGLFEIFAVLMGLKMHIDVGFKFLSTSVEPTLDINGLDFFKWFHIINVPEIFLAQLAYSDAIRESMDLDVPVSTSSYHKDVSFVRFTDIAGVYNFPVGFHEPIVSNILKLFGV